MSRCKTCSKPKDSEDLEKRRRIKRESAARKRRENPEKFQQATARYRERNRPRVLEAERNRKRAFYGENPEKYRATVKQYRTENADLVHARDRERRKSEQYQAARRAWVERNREKLRGYAAVTRAKRARAEGRFSPEDVEVRFGEQGGLCRWCGVSLCDEFCVDHVIPLARGGSNWPGNICVACPTCNMRKGAMMPEDFEARLASERESERTFG